MSLETNGSVVYWMIPWRGGFDAASFIAWLTSSLVTLRLRRQVRSVMLPSGTGTRRAMPVSLPLRSGMTSPTALAAPVVDGMMLIEAARARYGSEWIWSATRWSLVKAWQVVISPFSMPKAEWRTLAIGARQLVVHEALETIRSVGLSWSSLTPRTIVASSLSLAGALRTTFWAPASMCFCSAALL